MKTIFTTLILVLCFKVHSQKLTKTYWDKFNKNIMYEYYIDNYGNRNGSYTYYSVFGGVLGKGQYKDNLPVGKFTEYNSDGKLERITIFDTPGTADFYVINGKIIEYHSDGKTIKSETNYKDGFEDGIWKKYDEKGNIIGEGKYIDKIFIPTGISKKRYEEEEEKNKLLEEEKSIIQTEEYNKIILEAEKNYENKDYLNTLQSYKRAYYLKKEIYPKDKIYEIINMVTENKMLYDELFKFKNDTIINDFSDQNKEFKLNTIKEFNYSTYLNEYKKPIGDGCHSPWHLQNESSRSVCYRNNKEFYLPYQIAITESYFKYIRAIEIERDIVLRKSTNFDFENIYYNFYNYDLTNCLNNIKVYKDNYELSVAFKNKYKKALENNDKISILNKKNKKKILFEKYLIVHEDIISKVNINDLNTSNDILNTLNTLSEKTISLYDQNTKDIEKKLKNAVTSEEIQKFILGN